MPKLYYGWIVLIGTFAANLSFGVFFSFGVFYTPLIQEFGWTKAQTASIISVAALFQTAGGVAMGALADRRGGRTAFLVAAPLMGFGLALSVFSNLLWQWYVFYGAMAGSAWGAAATVPVVMAVKWFTRRRALAAGITVMGAGVATTIFPTFSAYLIGIQGWRTALLLNAVTFSSLLLLAAVLVRERPPRAPPSIGMQGNGYVLREGSKARSLWLLFSLFFLPSAGLLTVYTYLPAVSLSRSVDPLLAAGAISALGASSILGRIGSFLLVRLWGSIRTLTVVFVMMTASTLLLLGVFTVPTLYAFAVLYGVAYGVWIADMPVATREVFTGPRYGSVWGIINAGGGLGSLAGPLAVGLLLDPLGLERTVLLSVIAVTGAGSLLSLFVKRPAG